MEEDLQGPKYSNCHLSQNGGSCPSVPGQFAFQFTLFVLENSEWIGAVPPPQFITLVDATDINAMLSGRRSVTIMLNADELHEQLMATSSNVTTPPDD